MTAAVEYVVLVDETGAPVGRELKSLVHTVDTPLHLAFSLYLFDHDDRLLMTRRALSKVTWPGVWTNSCCGHPMPGESMTDAIRRRVDAELGLAVVDLECVLPDFAYRTRDVSGIWENEVCPVFIGRTGTRSGPLDTAPAPAGLPTTGHPNGLHPAAAIRPNPLEVVDWVWTPWSAVSAAMTATPFAFSPWSVQQVALLAGSSRAGTFASYRPTASKPTPSKPTADKPTPSEILTGTR